MEYYFTDANGRNFAAKLSIGDTQQIALTLANRARRKGVSTVKALGGQITLAIEER